MGKTIDDFTAVSTPAVTDTFLVTQSGVSLKETSLQLVQAIKATDSQTVAGTSTTVLVTPASAKALLQTLGFAINEAKGTNIASAATTDIGAATGNYVIVTGTVTITALGTANAGTRRLVEFSDVLTLTHNGTSLVLPTGSNIITADGDAALFVSAGSGNWKCHRYMRANGRPLRGLLQTAFTQTGAVATGTTAIENNDTIPQITEGDEYMTCSITPLASTSSLLISVVLHGTSVLTSRIIAALFRGSTLNALAVGSNMGAEANAITNVSFMHRVAAGSTATTSFSVRAGISTNSGFTFNGINGSRYFGGNLSSSILIEELNV